MEKPAEIALPSEKLSLRAKIGFGLGDIYGGGSGIVIGFYYLYFLTDVIRINPALAGTAFLISKLYDAVTDPFEGILTDRTRSPLGRRRPYLLAGILLVFLSFFLMWYPAALQSESARFAYVILTYLFFSTVVSIVMTAYNALASELTLDYHERTSVSSIRIFFSSFSSVLAAVLPLEIVKMAPDPRTGYTWMGLAFGVFFALPFLATFFSTRERPEFQKPLEPIDWYKTFIAPFRMKTFVYVLLMYILAFVAMDAVSSIVIYFMKYYLGRGNEANYVSGALLVAQVASLPFYVWVSRKTGKKTGYLVGAFIWMATMLFSFLVTPAAPGWFVYVFALMVGLGTGGIVVMIYAMFPDIPDVDELQTGQRREGTYSSITTFSRKLSSAIALFMISNMLAIAGYHPPVEETANGVVKVVEQVQTAQFITDLRLVFAFVPLVLVALALVVAFRYPLSSERHARLNTVLKVQRSGNPLSPELEREAQLLRSELIN
jgi:oligogalacturonide transporter